MPNNQFASLSELLAQYTPTLANPQYKISPIKIPPIKHFIIK
ncbi:hypothetical protein [Helicobacter sp.]|nr:hypothetical protein [Helicobacter sp.]